MNLISTEVNCCVRQNAVQNLEALLILPKGISVSGHMALLTVVAVKGGGALTGVGSKNQWHCMRTCFGVGMLNSWGGWKGSFGGGAYSPENLVPLEPEGTP